MRILISGLIFTLTILVSCDSGSSGIDREDSLEGTWEILDALRNGRRTTTLKDGFISFDSTGSMSTNILGKTTVSNFIWDENLISSDGEFDYDFNIEKLSGDTMILSGKMKAFDMVFYLMKFDSTRVELDDVVEPDMETDHREDHIMD